MQRTPEHTFPTSHGDANDKARPPWGGVHKLTGPDVPLMLAIPLCAESRVMMTVAKQSVVAMVALSS